MACVRFILQRGTKILETQAAVNTRLAQVIKDSGIGDPDFSHCGFKLECGSCAVNIDHSLAGAPKIEELMLLKSMGDEKSTRCSCQIQVSEKLEGKTIKLVW
ncbi:unnamed protein product [Blepharisma stoltei]|uniref:Ferredoxin n=1 Tax=Blepharisma stoltei TaxID=1481888 RepID=A0AAU9K8Q8_9CILI|nr:unnamed protein product [Blepharisma stoltei]